MGANCLVIGHGHEFVVYDERNHALVTLLGRAEQDHNFDEEDVCH
jgi:hypothetical protein